MRKILLLLLVALLPSPGAAQSDDWTVCTTGFSPDDVIRACTAVIDSGRESGKRLARAYYQRGFEESLMAPADRDTWNAKAKSDFGQALTLDPANSDAFALRGNILFDERRYADAIPDLQQATKLKPEAGVGENLGKSFERTGQLSAAQAAFDALAKSLPKDEDVFNARGKFHYRNGHFPQAAADFTKALSLERNGYATYRTGTLYWRRGLAKRAAGNEPGAAADIAKAKSLFPTMSEPDFD